MLLPCRAFFGTTVLACALVAACALHVTAAALLPSWLLLPGRSVPPLRRLRWLLLLIIPACGAGFLLFRYSERFYGGLEAFVPLLSKGSHSYTLLSSHHFNFVGNEIFLLLINRAETVP